MSFAQASAFTSLKDIPDRPSTSISSQRALSGETYPKAAQQRPSHAAQPYHLSASMPAVSPEEQPARLEAAYSSRPHAPAGSHGYQFLGDPGYPISSSAAGAHEGKKTAHPWPTSNVPLSKCPYSPLSMFPCGSGKTPDRGDKVSTLKGWLYEHRKHPYPTKGEKVMLAVITKMTLTQVSTWFANARRRLKKDSKTTLPAIDRCKDDDDDDDDDDRNDDSNEIGEAPRAPASSNIKSRKALFTHLSTDKETEKITAPNESIVQDIQDSVGDENDVCKHGTSETASLKTYQNSPIVADSTQDAECSLPSDRPLLEAMSDSHMPDRLSVGEKQHGGQSPLKIRCGRSGRDLKPQVSSRLPNKVSPSGEKASTSQVSSREVSSSTCGRPKIWSVTDFINTPLPSTKLTATTSLSTTATTTASTWYSSLPSASIWTSNSLSPLMTTAAMLPSAHPKSLPSQHHRSLSHEGIIHWPPSAASSFARLTNSCQPRSLPYPHTTGRLAIPVSGQESTAATDGQSWPTLCLHSVYPMFPARVVFSPP